MNKKVEITIKDFLTVEQYKNLNNVEHLSDFAKFIKVISLLSGIEEDEVRTWAPTSITQVYNDVIEAINVKTEFYPIIEKDGVQYGYSNIHQMTLGEYVDLERLSKDPHDNLEQIAALLYRPIKEHKFKTLKFRFKHNVRLATKNVDNIFKYYTLEKYDSSDREVRAEIFKDFPVAMILGALGFFLSLANLSLVTTIPSSKNKKQYKRRLTKMKAIEEQLKVMVNTGGGLAQFIHYPNQAFSISQEKRVLLT
jgi:hypothetical protein